MGAGIEANTAPNFPDDNTVVKTNRHRYPDNPQELLDKRIKSGDLPRIEKKIMNAADICTTLLLPTRVSAKRPAFSLHVHK